MAEKADVIVIGAGLAGLTAAHMLVERGKKVIILDQEGEQSLGGQAFWSVGGLFMVDTPQQRRLGIKDSYELALQDWMGTAQFDRQEDFWPSKWAEAYVEFCSGEMHSWLKNLGMKWFSVVGWAERGGALAHGHGNSVPRFHLTWGLGPATIEPFVLRLLKAAKENKVKFAFRHRVSSLITENNKVAGVSGEILEAADNQRGEKTSRHVIGDFEMMADAIIVASGGIGGNLDLVRKNWPVQEMGQPPETMILGVPHHVDGRMLQITKEAGGSIINSDRMWHYTEGLKNWNSIWPDHGIRILPGPSSIWFDATGNRLPAPYFPGFDTRGTLKHIMSTGYDYSWFVTTKKIIDKEFALSGSEQNPDFTSRSIYQVIKGRFTKSSLQPVQNFLDHGEDFVVSNNLTDLVSSMNELTKRPLIDHDHLKMQIDARDREIDNPFCKDAQILAVRGFRNYFGDKVMRTVKPHKILDQKNGPLVAVRLNILTRKSLGGLHTNLDSQVLNDMGQPIPGLYAVGEVSGFGGGGYHGYSSLEGTFLGGCLYSGKVAGTAALS